MPTRLRVLLAPAEIAALRREDLGETTCVVFDILRATTTMLTALANGAEAIVPVEEIAEALDWKARHPDVLLGGERQGLRIGASLTGGVEFDLGNSPAEYMRDVVEGRTIVMTTTNGTRALRACLGASAIYLGSFLNLRAVTQRLQEDPPESLLLVCSGTGDQPALEDILAAGALCEKVWSHYSMDLDSDGPEVARRLHALMGATLGEAMLSACNGRRLLAQPHLRDDVPRCVQRETLSILAGMDPEGVVRRIPAP